ncbi:glycosyltransferase [Cytophagaceae bacterium DM2B3-1]|uniref:Glycosyltransferase n=1 Tax=Xanthocytophaga flava TaxID=3048013 RepID=A0ABT7CDJ0_9BACT|nr:glycosyltransferase [Xanthocytophaga flavus]MDJ1491708.1 glycosyltransferase [Xanthocytophaga flavus]
MKRQSGVDTRYYELIAYLKNRGFSIDLCCSQIQITSTDKEELEASSFIDNVFILDFSEKGRKKGKETKNGRKDSFRSNLIVRSLMFLSRKLATLAHKISPQLPPQQKYAYENLPNMVSQEMKDQFLQILSSKNYNYLLISYVYWANLVLDIPLTNITTLLGIEDSATLQAFYLSNGNIRIGNLLEEEIRRVNLFDKVLCISDDERIFFSQFTTKPAFFYIPQFFHKRSLLSTTELYSYDILFIGSDNIHNQKSISWFFDYVYPLLNPQYQLLIVGNITSYIGDYPNVTKIKFADNLDFIYEKVKLSICPMLQGTGMKIKVVEALSYEKPVVCTSKGVDGFNQKRNNGCIVTDLPEEFAQAITNLLTNEAFYHEQKSTAKYFFEDNFEYKAVGKVLDSVFK